MILRVNLVLIFRTFGTFFFANRRKLAHVKVLTIDVVCQLASLHLQFL